MPDIISVTELNLYVKELIAGSNFLSAVQVRGEISNFKYQASSGHMYMSLKDKGAVIRAVMFAGSAKKLQFMPEDGMKIIASGRVAVFERDGQYQLYISDLIPEGIGSLQIAFEQLKQKLYEEGLFDERRKKKIPDIPLRIGVITSPDGAAVRDVINITGRRFPLAKIIVCPVLVQGENAAGQLTKAVALYNKRDLADVLIIGRGGGSIEDLWAFNDEGLAREICASRIPVISAVGHETDFTICDFVSDLRAPTPSAAAELAVPSAMELKNTLSACSLAMRKLLQNKIEFQRKESRKFRENKIYKNPNLLTDEKKMTVSHLLSNLQSGQKIILERCKSSFSAGAAKLDALSPLGALARGYALAEKGEKIVKSAKELKKEDEITLRFCDGTVDCRVK